LTPILNKREGESPLPQNELHEGHRDRVKKRFLKSGLADFEPHNMLELLLFYSVPRRDTNELAHSLIAEFGSLKAVFDADYEQLLNVSGVGEGSALLIKLIPELSRAYLSFKGASEQSLNSPEAAGSFAITQFIALNKEHMLLICLDNKGKILNSQMIFEGEINYVNINTRKLIEQAVKYRASAVIIAHNHPNGKAYPSGDDSLMTVVIRDALKLIDVILADHIICDSEGNYFSMLNSADFKIFLSNSN
jgi:DNA repair protein RadC